MARQFSLVQNLKVIQVFAPKTTNGSLSSQVVSLKNAHKAWVVFEFTQAVGHATTPTLVQATSIAATTNKAGPAVEIWANEDTAASDTLVRKTAAASYAVTNDVKNKEVVFEIDPSRLDVNGGYDCIYFTEATSSQATNFVSATAYLLAAYQQATPPSAILD
jgi:hypothetical protein